MNRYGNILNDFDFEPLFRGLSSQIVLPLARHIWPQWVAPSDCDETYGFVVRYKMGEDHTINSS